MKTQSKIKEVILRQLLKPCQAYVSLDKEHVFKGPLRGDKLSREKLKQIVRYRISFYENHIPYLRMNSLKDLKREYRLALKSYHVWCEDQQNNILGTGMFTPNDFNFKSYLTEKQKQQFNDYLEISRLLVVKQRQGIGMRLLLVASQDAKIWSKYRGIVAVCKSQRMSMYRLVGVKNHSKIKFEERNGQVYNLISANVSKMVIHLNLISIMSLLKSKFNPRYFGAKNELRQS